MRAGMDERRARMILNALPEVGPVTFRRLLDAVGSASGILEASRERLLSVRGVGPAMADAIGNAPALFDFRREEDRMERRGLRFVIPGDAAYPPLLRELYDPPLGLYAAGGYEPASRCVALVGTRATTSYGRGLAREVAATLTRAGWCVVSGLARGVDAEAHRGALDAGGATVAVLGCGADIVYPPENLGLYRDIVAAGVVYSEFPLGRPADRRTFPMRNRIVAGMCRAVVVIESDEDGGSMITARFAAEAGRVVCAFPGRVDSPVSRGCHALIRDGATLVMSPEQILEELGETVRQPALDFGADEAGEPPEPEGAALLKCFEPGESRTPDGLAEATGLPVAEVVGRLLMLEITGHLVRRTNGAYEAVRRKRV